MITWNPREVPGTHSILPLNDTVGNKSCNTYNKKHFSGYFQGLPAKPQVWWQDLPEQGRIPSSPMSLYCGSFMSMDCGPQGVQYYGLVQFPKHDSILWSTWWRSENWMPSGFGTLRCWASLVRGISEFQGMPTLLIRNTENHISVLHRAGAALLPGMTFMFLYRRLINRFAMRVMFSDFRRSLAGMTPWHVTCSEKMCQGFLWVTFVCSEYQQGRHGIMCKFHA